MAILSHGTIGTVKEALHAASGGANLLYIEDSSKRGIQLRVHPLSEQVLC